MRFWSGKLLQEKAGPRTDPIFSRDCPEYETNVNGATITMLCNHLKSKGYGSQASSNKKRKRQAERVNEILTKYNLDTDYVVVAGDLNDTPKSKPLQSLLTNNMLFNLVDEVSGSKGTYLNTEDQIDYLLVSKALFERLSEVAIERRGIFKNGQVDPFKTVTGPEDQASDHAAVWASFDI